MLATAVSVLFFAWSAASALPASGLSSPVMVTPVSGDQVLTLDVQWRPVDGAASYRVAIREQGRTVVDEIFVLQHLHAPTRLRLTSAQMQPLTGRGVSVSVSACADEHAERCGRESTVGQVYVRGPEVEVLGAQGSDLRWRPYAGFAASADSGALHYEVALRFEGQPEQRHETSKPYLALDLAGAEHPAGTRLAWQVVACNAVNCSSPGRTQFLTLE